METDFIRNRILWKVRRSGVPNNRVVLYEDLPEDFARSISKVGDVLGSPVLVYMGSGCDTWTLVSTEEVVSSLEGVITRISMESVDRTVTIGGLGERPVEEVKKFSQTILAGKSKTEIWAPAGENLFVLMGILKMLPLGKRESMSADAHNQNNLCTRWRKGLRTTYAIRVLDGRERALDRVLRETSHLAQFSFEASWLDKIWFSRSYLVAVYCAPYFSEDQIGRVFSFCRDADTSASIRPVFYNPIEDLLFENRSAYELPVDVMEMAKNSARVWAEKHWDAP